MLGEDECEGLCRGDSMPGVDHVIHRQSGAGPYPRNPYTGAPLALHEGRLDPLRRCRTCCIYLAFSGSESAGFNRRARCPCCGRIAARKAWGMARDLELKTDGYRRRAERGRIRLAAENEEAAAEVLRAAARSVERTALTNDDLIRLADRANPWAGYQGAGVRLAFLLYLHAPAGARADDEFRVPDSIAERAARVKRARENSRRWGRNVDEGSYSAIMLGRGR